MGFAAAAPVIGSVVSGLFAKKGAADANKASAQMAREQMDFQERMSSTAHQREVKDLLAAGLNPVLSGTGGAGSSTPAGASSTFENENEGFAGLSQAAASAFAVRNMKQELRNLQRQEQLIKQQERKTGSEADQQQLTYRLMTEYGHNNAASAADANRASADIAKANVPGAQALGDLWKDLGEGGEVFKGLGAAAPFVKMLLPLIMGGKK